MSTTLTTTGLLPPPAGGGVDLLIVAGEHSGDEHAARLVRQLREKNPDLRVCALGGPRLAVAGAQLLLDLTANSTMGFAVLSRLSYFRTVIAAVVSWVGRHRPRAVCFVDSSGLNLRIAKGLFEQGLSAKAGGPTKAVYFISPQIWASRAGRRFAMAKHLDGLAAIFPFEPAVYADTTLPVTFVGHPFLAPDHAPPVTYDPNGPVLLLPGSRAQVVRRIFPVLLDAYRRSGTQRPAVVLYPSDEILAVLKTFAVPAGVTFQPTGAAQGPVAAAAVLTASGTMSMHCALAGIPGALTYKTDPLTYWIGRWIVKVPFIGIANLILKEPMYQEFIQGQATGAALGAALQAALTNQDKIESTRRQMTRLRGLLAQPTGSTAADWLGSYLG